MLYLCYFKIEFIYFHFYLFKKDTIYVIAGWETLPYPPAQGDFAVYSIDELVEGVNFAVSQASKNIL